MKNHPASMQRRMYWSKDIGGTARCPECGERTEVEDHTYLMAIRYPDGEITESMVGSDEGGWFCSNCPIVVLNYEIFEDLARLSAESSFVAFTAIGSVDLDAVPEERAHLPFDEDENPIPLVEFLDPPRIKSGEGHDLRKTKSKNQRKRERKKRK